MLRPGFAAGAALLVVSSYSSAQVSLGVAAANGIAVHPGPAPVSAALPQAPAAWPVSPGRASHSSPGAQDDLFLAHPGTYAPQFDARGHRDGFRDVRRHRLPLTPYGALPTHRWLLYGGGSPIDAEAPIERQLTSFDERDGARVSGYLRLEVRPDVAQVYVDGFFVGSVGDVNAALPLEPGLHRVEILAEGFEPAAFDVRVRTNQTVRVAATLERAQGRAPDSIAAGAAPAAAKTLYVIPRCYAGDRRPLASDLPAGCRLVDLRVVVPGVK